MTTIAWDGHTMASDSCTSAGRFLTGYTWRKIFPVVTEYQRLLVGTSGSTAMGAFMVKGFQAFDEEETPVFASPFDDRGDDEERHCRIMVVDANQKKCILYNDKVIDFVFPITHKFAIGSGDDYALSALDLGLDARAAVEHAKKWCLDTRGPVRTWTLEALENMTAEESEAYIAEHLWE